MQGSSAMSEYISTLKQKLNHWSMEVKERAVYLLNALEQNGCDGLAELAITNGRGSVAWACGTANSDFGPVNTYTKALTYLCPVTCQCTGDSELCPSTCPMSNRTRG